MSLVTEYSCRICPLSRFIQFSDNKMIMYFQKQNGPEEGKEGEGKEGNNDIDICCVVQT